MYSDKTKYERVLIMARAPRARQCNLCGVLQVLALGAGLENRSHLIWQPGLVHVPDAAIVSLNS